MELYEVKVEKNILTEGEFVECISELHSNSEISFHPAYGGEFI